MEAAKVPAPAASSCNVYPVRVESPPISVGGDQDAVREFPEVETEGWFGAPGASELVVILPEAADQALVPTLF